MAYGSAENSNFWRDKVLPFFQRIGQGLKSWFKGYTGQELTPAQKEANAFSANEAEKARAWEQQMSNTAFQRQVSDMQAAGVNPALMYGGAGSAGASTPSSNAPSSVSAGQPQFDPISLISAVQSLGMYSLQKEKLRNENKILEKQAEGIGLDNQGKEVELKYKEQQIVANLMRTINAADKDAEAVKVMKKQGEYLDKQIDKYDAITDAQIAEMWSRVGLNDANQKVAQQTYDKLVIECAWMPKVYAAQIAGAYAAANEHNANASSMPFKLMKTVTLKQARSMGVNFSGFGINGSMSDDTLILICPNPDYKGYKMIGFGSDDVQKPSDPKVFEGDTLDNTD